MTAVDILVETFVPGHPKTKGSLNEIGGRMVESVQGSTQWRRLVTQQVRAWLREQIGIWSVRGPFGVRLAFWLPVADVAAGRPGDIDKLARNVLDALTDAGVYVDDAQVVRLLAEKYPVTAERPQGVLIQVWRIADWLEYAE